MARKILVDTAYTFTPSTATIVIPRYIPRERLILITDVTKNIVLYNFSDSTLTATSYVATAGQTYWGSAGGTTTITLAYNTNTAVFSATDKLQIMIDEYEERFTPAETQLDPTNKLRTTTPQSLIDTDFEYSFQPTKWEFFQSQNWNASVYTSTSNSVLAAYLGGAGFSLTGAAAVINCSGGSGTITGMTLPSVPFIGSYVYVVDAGNATTNFSSFRYAITAASTTSVTVTGVPGGLSGNQTVQQIIFGNVNGTTANPTYAAFQVSSNLTSSGVNLLAGQPVLAQDTQNEPYCDGTFVVAYINQAQGAFSYFPKVNQQFSQNQLQKSSTSLFVGGYYAAGYGLGSIIPISGISTDSTGHIVTVTTYSNHNLVTGAPVYVGNMVLTAGNGPQYVASVPSPYSFTYQVPGSGISASQSGSSTLQNTTVVYARPEGYQIQRSADGGIGIFGGNAVPGAQSLRQTRRYFRYQAGKGIQYSTSSTFKPNMDIVGISFPSAGIMNITTDQDHGLKTGAYVNLRNIASSVAADLSIYNNTFSVSPIVNLTSKTFAVQYSGTIVDQTPGIGIATVETADAKGGSVRCGLFDDMNGFFYEFDGTLLNAVRRNGTTVMRGTTNVCTGSTIVIGTGSLFTRQVQAGDKVIIRGQVYEISQVVNDNVVHIAPAYRAASPAVASGTAGIPIAYITGGASTTQTVTISTNATTQQITFTALAGTGTAGTGGIGVAGAYQIAGTISRTWSTTLSASALANATSVTVTSTNSGAIVPGMLVICTAAGSTPSGTFVSSTYIPGSSATVIPLTQGMLSGVASGSTIDFFYSPASGMNVIAGTMAQGIVPNGTQVSSFTNTANSSGATITIQLYINQGLTATTTTTTLLIGTVPGYTAASLYTTTTNVIALNTTYGISPGMTITGTGVPGNAVVAGLAAAGTGVILNTGITTSVSNSTTLTFAPNLSLYAITIQTSSSSSASSTFLTMNNVNGIQIGSFVTTTANTNIPINTFVIGINTSTNVVQLYTPFTTTQGLTGSGISSGVNIVFGSRIFVTGATSTNANGMWPVTAITSTTLTYQTAATVSASTVISVYGTTKMFGEDVAVKKYHVRELRVPQYQFNLDSFDGTGPSGFNMDLTKIQMIYIDYSWYGAGFIRWGARTINGDIQYAHKVQHGNREYLAFQRSGNLPGRFEVVNTGARSPLTTQINATGYVMSASPTFGTINVYDASRFFIPSTQALNQSTHGEVNIDGEIFYYTGVAATTTQSTTGNPDAVTQNIAYPYGAQSTAAPWATGVNGLTAVATVGTVSVANGSVQSIAITSGGLGYTSSPPVTIAGGGGAGCIAKAIVVNGSVTSVVVTNGGYGYTSAPTVIIGANQLTGAFRESTAVSYINTGNAVSGTTLIGTNQITNVTAGYTSNIAIGMVIQGVTNFGYLNVRIIGFSGTTIYVDTLATSSGSMVINIVNRGISTASVHYNYNNSGNPLSNVWNTTIMLAPNVQHWGVSCIMDGRYDSDKSYVFTTPRSTAAVVQPNQTSPLISIRVSPSASNGFARNFGVRDIIMRMQANLYQMDVFNAGPFLVTVKYNCASTVFTPALWTANVVGSGSLSQVIYHNPSDIVTGGDIVVAFYANASGGTFFTDTSADLTVVKDLGNSVYGGDGVFPDGPDVITVFATNLSTQYANQIFSRISWTEAQA